MSANNFETTLAGYINEELLADSGNLQIGLADELLVEGYIDSLGIMRLVGFIESELAITVPPDDVTIENFNSVAVLADYLRRRSA